MQSGQSDKAFDDAFEAGNILFETEFEASEGVGALVGNGERFTRAPRADLKGPGEWANHFPARATGPNAQSCTACHAVPDQDGSGFVVANESRDPFHKADPAFFINRNTPHLFGMGAVQRLAEEMTEELHALRDAAKKSSCASGAPVIVPLITKGTDYGTITVTCSGVDTTNVIGIDKDLVVKPFQWKGIAASIRSFNRAAAHNELGMQGVELVGEGVDGDFDGVTNELSVGDLTAMTVYNAAQPRPTTKIELEALHMIPKMSKDYKNSVTRGLKAFKTANCASCHTPELLLKNPIFSEPSQNPYFRDATFPSGKSPVSASLDPKFPITFDLTKDQHDNVIKTFFGKKYRLGSFYKDKKGYTVVRLYSDLKRHDLGREVAESIDEMGTGSSVFLTRPLWGVGTTAPYMHDGRATTLEEAIAYHGGEAAGSRAAYNALSQQDRADLIAYLKNEVLFKTPENESGRRGD